MSATEIRRLLNLLEGQEPLTEMPMPTDAMRAKVYYHGCPTDTRGQQILDQGIAPQVMDYHSPRGALTPVPGKVYMAQGVGEALGYALHGSWAGTAVPPESLERFGRYGWVFVIDGRDLGDIQPDEDSVGAFLSDNAEPIKKETVGWQGQTYMRTVGYRFKHTAAADDRQKEQVWDFISRNMTDKQRDGALDGFMTSQSAGGKRVLKKMPDWMKLALIGWGAHVAHHGPIIPVQAWRVDKLDSPKYVKDGSNFFELAERVR